MRLDIGSSGGETGPVYSSGTFGTLAELDLTSGGINLPLDLRARLAGAMPRLVKTIGKVVSADGSLSIEGKP
jgi:hypothetical protein